MFSIPEVSRPMDNKHRLSTSLRLDLQDLMEPPTFAAFLLNSQSLSLQHLSALLKITLFRDPGLQPLDATLPANPATSEAMPSEPRYNTQRTLTITSVCKECLFTLANLTQKHLVHSSTNQFFKYSSWFDPMATFWILIFLVETKMMNDYSSRFQYFRGQTIIGLVCFLTLVKWNLFVSASGALNVFIAEGNLSSTRLARSLCLVTRNWKILMIAAKDPQSPTP